MHVHDYVTIGENNDAVVEICKECKKRLITRKDSKGRVNNKEYLKEHVRDTAQPKGPTKKIFNRFYGTKISSSKNK